MDILKTIIVFSIVADLELYGNYFISICVIYTSNGLRSPNKFKSKDRFEQIQLKDIDDLLTVKNIEKQRPQAAPNCFTDQKL